MYIYVYIYLEAFLLSFRQVVRMEQHLAAAAFAAAGFDARIYIYIFIYRIYVCLSSCTFMLSVWRVQGEPDIYIYIHVCVYIYIEIFGACTFR